jgi:hypothetical protein
MRIELFRMERMQSLHWHRVRYDLSWRAWPSPGESCGPSSHPEGRPQWASARRIWCGTDQILRCAQDDKG